MLRSVVLMTLVAMPALAHDPYMGWMIPGTVMSCCSNKDCMPTRAYMHDDGLWRAWDGIGWLTVPASKLLPHNKAGDGRSHLCSTPRSVLCFSPGDVRG